MDVNTGINRGFNQLLRPGSWRGRDSVDVYANMRMIIILNDTWKQVLSAL